MITESIILYTETVINNNYKNLPTVIPKVTEKELETYLTLADKNNIKEKAIFKHKIIPNATIEILGFQLNPTNTYMFKGEPCFIRVKEYKQYHNTQSTMALFEILNDYDTSQSI